MAKGKSARKRSANRGADRDSSDVDDTFYVSQAVPDADKLNREVKAAKTPCEEETEMRRSE